jgi:hypothetical protein
VLICLCGAFSLIGFPLDDLWHHLFGQDVTLWGPTHLMLISGAAMTLVGMGVLTVEGIRMRAQRGQLTDDRPVVLARAVAQTGGFLLGLSTFQAEFDFGVPQFNFLFEPMMVMLASGVALVVARIYAGRGAAIGAALFFVLARGGLALLIGPVLGETTPHLPLYIVEALVVEAVALRISTDRPLAFGLWSGLGIGTVGLAAEWAWSHVWMPLPWPSALFPEAAIAGLAVAIAAALIGAWIGTRLSPEPGVRHPRLRVAACLSAVTIAGLTIFALHTPADRGVSARVTLRDIKNGSSERMIGATVHLSPPNSAEGAEWFNVTAWQGGGLVVDPLERVAPGTYRTTEPVPADASWKTMIRLHKGSSLTAAPIYLPLDAAIPAPEVPAKASFTRPFVDETQILQREKTGGSPALVAIAYATVAGIALSLLVLLAWSLHRLAFPPKPDLRRSRGQAATSPTPSLQR